MTRTKFNASMLNDPLFIGFDRVLDRMQAVNNATVARQSNYPPYNIVKIDDDNYTIELALAGFKDEEINVMLKEGILYVEGNQDKMMKENTYIVDCQQDPSNELLHYLIPLLLMAQILWMVF